MKKRVLFITKFLFVVSICFTCISGYKINEPKEYVFQFDFLGENSESVQVFFDSQGDQLWKEQESELFKVKKNDEWLRVSCVVPENIKNIRIDINDKVNSRINSKYSMRDFAFDYKKMKILSVEEVSNNITVLNQVALTSLDGAGNLLDFKSEGNDPFYIIDVSDNYTQVRDLDITDFVNYFIVSIIVWVLIRKVKFDFQGLKNLCGSFKENRSLIARMGFNDFKTKFASSYLGILWGFVNPLINILVYWFVFQVAFKSGDVNGAPFILWFLCGIVPWFYFSEALNTTTNSFIEYNYLIKKVKFNVEILPFIKILSSLFVHLFFVVIIFAVMGLYGYYPDLYNIQIIYYIFCMVVLVYAIGVFTSAVVPFFRDLGQIIAIILNVGFWFTPIGWNLDIIPQQFQIFLKMNPMYYIVNGFRDSFISNITFWERPYQTLYFWSFVLVILFLGLGLFKKLKAHFADVL